MIDRHTTLLVWVVLGASVAACQLAAMASKSRLPGLGTVVGSVAATTVGRVLLVATWMWLGWHAFAR
jgi:Family of unknown function (DUF6186)